MRLVSIGSWYGAERPFEDMFTKVVTLANKDIPKFSFSEGDVLVFGGGADVWSGMYKQKPNRYNGTTGETERDMFERYAFEQAYKAGSKMLGICRGAQLLCALSGGSLIQHVSNHGVDHMMTTHTGEDILVSSVHHQMMNPEGTEHELIGWSKDKRSRCYFVEENKEVEMDCEPEVVFFPASKALSIQYHPEFMDPQSRGVLYARELVSSFLMA